MLITEPFVITFYEIIELILLNPVTSKFGNHSDSEIIRYIFLLYQCCENYDHRNIYFYP